MNSQDKDLKLVSFIKVVMMICVVICHSCGIFTLSGWGGVIPLNNSIVLGKISTWLGTFHVQTFTFISGYLFYMLRYEKGRYRTAKKDITARAKRLIVPYIFASIVWVIPAYFLFYGFSIKKIIKNYLLGVSPAQLWFLIMLFMMYLMFYFMSDWIIKLKPFIGMTFMVLLNYITTGLAIILPIGIFQISTVLQFSIYFYFGCIIRRYGINILCKIPSIIPLIINLMLFYFYENIKYFFGDNHLLISILIKPFVSLCGIWFVVSFFNKIEINKIRNTKLFKLLSDNSMGIYLIHQQIIYITIRIFNIAFLPPGLFFLINFLISIILSTIISSLIGKRKLGRVLLGL